jgi:hypothetical protein
MWLSLTECKMPYLHWETDRHRARVADEIDRQSDKNDRGKREINQKMKRYRQDEREELQKLKRNLSVIKHDDPDYYRMPPNNAGTARRNIEDILWTTYRNWKFDKARLSGEDMSNSSIFRGLEYDELRRFRPKHPLAQYLIDAARLFDDMATFQDCRLLHKYLFSDPPLHPRRTLDQSYFWKLSSTRRRDRDQVVYRYTHTGYCHEFRRQPNYTQNKAFKKLSTSSPSPSDGEVGSMEGWAWSRHGKYEDKRGCDQCEADSKQLSRVIMVDQLWMWILDKNTILTFFPRRYGVNKDDPSGVHQSIRDRLSDQTNPSNHVRSVFDLALIVLDECFDTFFDRTITLDRRPQIMDMFAESIGKVV